MHNNDKENVVTPVVSNKRVGARISNSFISNSFISNITLMGCRFYIAMCKIDVISTSFIKQLAKAELLIKRVCILLV